MAGCDFDVGSVREEKREGKVKKVSDVEWGQEIYEGTGRGGGRKERWGRLTIHAFWFLKVTSVYEVAWV